MFDLEQAIADGETNAGRWHQNSMPLVELEIHLREDIAQQMQSGLSAQQAFQIAVQEIGKPGMLKREFKKWGKDAYEANCDYSTGSFRGLVRSRRRPPGARQAPGFRVWNSDIVTPIVLGTIITLVGLGVAVVGFKRRKA